MVVVYTLVLRQLVGMCGVMPIQTISPLRCVGVTLIILSTISIAFTSSRSAHIHHSDVLTAAGVGEGDVGSDVPEPDLLMGTLFVTVGTLAEATSSLWGQHLMASADTPIAPTRYSQMKAAVALAMYMPLLLLLSCGLKLITGTDELWLGGQPFMNIADGAFQLIHSAKLHWLFGIYLLASGFADLSVQHLTHSLSAIWASIVLPCRTISVWGSMLVLGTMTSALHHG